MTALLIVLALIAAIVWYFMRKFRQRVQASLQKAGHELPPELARQLAAMRAKGASPQAAAAAVVARAATLPAAAPRAALHFMLIYDVGPDFIQRRAQYRDEHLALAWRAAAAGELVLAGALEEPTEQAFLLFRGSREAATRFAQADPYVTHGLVRQWRVKQWHTVVGDTAAMPVRPGGTVVTPRRVQ